MLNNMVLYNILVKESIYIKKRHFSYNAELIIGDNRKIYQRAGFMQAIKLYKRVKFIKQIQTGV